MTAAAPAAPAAPPSATDRVAAALGWTPGQVWTVALGLALAVPAGIFGLGPALHSAPTTPAALAAAAPTSAPPATGPSSAGADAPSDTATAPLPSILGGRSPTDASSALDQAPTGLAPDSAPHAGAPPPPVAGTVGAVEIPGPGTVLAVAAAADAVAVAVDRGTDEAAAVVVVDEAGRIAATVELVVDGVAHHGARGVAVVEGGVVVTTAAPAAVLLVDPADEHARLVAVLPDLPPCVPIAREDHCQPGIDAPPEPTHVTAAADGALYVVDRAQACVLRIEGDRTVPWLCDLAHVPSPAIEGSGLRGIAAADGRIVLTSRVALEAKDVVEEVVIDGDVPGARRRLVAVGATEQIDGVDVLADGSVVAALTGTGTVLVLPPDAPEGDRIGGFQHPADVAARADDIVVAERTDGAAGAIRFRRT